MKKDKRECDIKDSIISISNDKMSVSLILLKPEGNEKYTISAILKLLESYGIKYGIKRELIQLILNQRLYNEEYVIAEGKEKIDGLNGQYEFYFDTEAKPKPIINKDGSIDYKNIQCFVPVKQGDLVAKYKKATVGSDGKTVTGELLKPKKGKDLPKLKGKGFIYDESNGEYRAEISGKIELLQNKVLSITNVFQVPRNVDLSIGNINFDGDVYINGDVFTGFSVQATGSIFVEGCVEACIIKAGKDIVLKHGMQGADKGTIEAGGSIMGKFFEAVEIKCNGNFSANAVINCRLEAEGMIEVQGRFGAIVGGNLYGRLGIRATQVGNISGIRTVVQTGASKKQREQFLKTFDKIKEAEEKLKLFDYILSVYHKRKEIGVIAGTELENKRERVEASKEEILKRLAYYRNEKDRLKILIEQGQQSSIRVKRSIFSGSELIINEKCKIAKRDYENVSVYLKNGTLKIYSEE